MGQVLLRAFQRPGVKGNSMRSRAGHMGSDPGPATDCDLESIPHSNWSSFACL